ncbi:glutamate--cysteine ligase [Nanchangia anserum]|uniref:Putative glutamate--cysteine ligase 2 n=1 Tax=Nanchangia anserum TaxID=2692125 RepID=A0A8I0GEN3_9ACTO|nr:glutamate--cysteine ligase [Nanchangia anserum]MBD3689457.1 glutamate--cysteine ligase [Nanchangia anserum]QOX81656.1 glutamate--cysteine ligase [Nanchangia anserum]
MVLDFAQSPRSTLGIEWELQLVDRESHDLRQCGAAILEAVEREHPNNGLIHKEMLLNTVEVTSRPRATVAECISDLEEGAALVRPFSDALHVELTSAGSHPFADPTYQLVTDSARYLNLVSRTQYWGQQMLLFGTHVHVGVEDRAKLLPLLGYVATKLGHIQALFASSPYWGGVDTGYCDNRAMVFQQLPTAGQPRQFERWEQLESFTDDLTKTGIITCFDEIRWDIRPSPKFGTLEVRVGDASSNTKEVRAYAALIQSLVETGSRLLDAGHDLPMQPEWYVAENRWRAARYGMEATLIENAHGDEAPLRETLAGWLEELAPAARDLGCEDDLAWIGDLVRIGVGYQRQRAVWEKAGSLEAVVDFLQAETKADTPLDPSTFVSRARGVHVPRR